MADPMMAIITSQRKPFSIAVVNKKYFAMNPANGGMPVNDSIAMVKANATLLEKEEAKYQQQIKELTSKVKAAIQSGREDLAGTFATALEQMRSALARTQGQLQTARIAYEKALNVKKAFMREKEIKSQEALQAIRDHRRAEWQKKVADVMETFEVAGISATHDEMIRKVEEETAVNEARMEMALDNVDTQSVKIEEEAEKVKEEVGEEEVQAQSPQTEVKPEESKPARDSK